MTQRTNIGDRWIRPGGTSIEIFSDGEPLTELSNWVDSLPSRTRQLWLKDQQLQNVLQRAFKCDGRIDPMKPEQQMSLPRMLDNDLKHTTMMRDAFSTDLPFLMQRVVESTVEKAMEPVSTLSHSVFTRVPVNGMGIIHNVAMPALHAADIPEGGEYPERSIELAGNATTRMGKSGLAVRFTDELIKNSQFEIINRSLRLCADALVRHKEKKVAAKMLSDATVLLDNTDAGYRSSTGRNSAGAYNGTLTLDDLFDVYADMIDNGFTPNALVMHPSAWRIFATESIARAFGFANKGELMKSAKGNPGGQAWDPDPLASQAPSTPSNIATTWTGPSRLFPSIVKIITSPFLPYTASTSLTDIYLCQVGECGLVHEDQAGVETEDWRDPARDMQKFKLREFYSVSSINDGLGMGRLANVKLARSHAFLDSISVQMSTGNFPSGESLGGQDVFTGQPSDL